MASKFLVHYIAEKNGNTYEEWKEIVAETSSEAIKEFGGNSVFQPNGWTHTVTHVGCQSLPPDEEKEYYDNKKREQEERIRLQNENKKRDYERALADLPEAKAKINAARTSADFAQLSEKFSWIVQVLKSLPGSFEVQTQIEECETYCKQCEEQKNQHKKDETLSLFNTAKAKIPTRQTVDDYRNLAREFDSIGDVFKSLLSSFGVQVQIEECENYRKQCEREQERINREEQERQKKQMEAIRFRRVLAVIIQIVASISLFILLADKLFINFFFVGIGTALFCRIFFTGKGKGIISMILIILCSIVFILLTFNALTKDASGFLYAIGFFIFFTGISIAAILAFKSKNDY